MSLSNPSQIESASSVREHFIKNDSSEVIPPYGVCEIVSIEKYDEDQPLYHVIKPTGSLTKAVLFNGPTHLKQTKISKLPTHIVMMALIDQEISLSEIQDALLGPKKDEWALFRGEDDGVLPRYAVLGESLTKHPIMNVTLVGPTEKPIITVDLPLLILDETLTNLEPTEVLNRGGIFEINANKIKNIGGAKIFGKLFFSGEASAAALLETTGMGAILSCENDGVSHYDQNLTFIGTSGVTLDTSTFFQKQTFSCYVGAIEIEEDKSIEFKAATDAAPVTPDVFKFTKGFATLELQ